jgi:hypothetical protein
LLLAAPGRDHVQRRLFGSRIERPAQHLAVNGDDTLAGFGEAGDEALEAGAELVGVEAEQPAERVVTGRAALELQEAAKEVDLARGEFGHVDAVLAAVRTEQSAMTNISSRSCRAALPVRGSVRSAKQARKPPMVFPLRRSTAGRIDFGDRQQARPRRCQAISKCDSPGCAPLPLTRAMFHAVQHTDPRRFRGSEYWLRRRENSLLNSLTHFARTPILPAFPDQTGS